MNPTLDGMRVAILVDEGFEQVELEGPRRALDEAGARTIVVSPEKEHVMGWQHREWGQEIGVDQSLDRADPGQFDALMLPGGVMNSDRLRNDSKAVRFVQGFVDAGKPIAAICHAPWTLIEAHGVEGRRMTSWPSLRSDLIHAGASWVDEAVVRDGPLVTSRKPDDLPEFNRAMIGMFREFRAHPGRSRAA